jgi:predicted TIM-barrel fold metal-dependent hydrolase
VLHSVAAMGSVDLDFKPSVPVLDANVSLGRRHDRPVAVDTVEGVRSEMDRAGIGRVLVYAPHAATYDSVEGNSMLMDAVRGRADFVPQFVCNPAFDDLDTVAAHVEAEGVTSVRMLPGVHNYPFRDWVVGPWLDWLTDTGIPLWLPVEHEVLGTVHAIDPRDVYETLAARPNVRAVLGEAKYHDASWALPLVRSLPNLDFELSRFVVTGGITTVVDAIGPERVLFGSRFPDAAMSPQLYSLHHCGLRMDALRLICAGNAERLLGVS